MKKNIKILGVIGALVVLFGLGFLLTNGVLYYNYAVRKTTLDSGLFFIPTGTNFDEQTSLLIKNGFIKDSAEYQKVAKKFNFEKVLPGKYTITKDMTYRELLSVIGTGRQTPIKVTFNNIRTPEKLAGVISKYIEADSLQLLKAFNDESIITNVGLSKAGFMGLFIPNTYEFYWNTSAPEFVSRMKKEYDRFWSRESRDEKLKETGLTKEQVSTLASIIIEETKAEEEMPRIAGVYLNRINKGMLLQADPTVKYALGDPTIKRVLLRHLDVDSPYNTYKYAGLPPGVICVPPIVAIDAVLDHENHDLIYFCADSNLSGKHVFAKTLTEHSKNARKYALELNRRGIR